MQAQVHDRYYLTAQIHDAEHGGVGAAQGEQRNRKYYFLHLQQFQCIGLLTAPQAQPARGAFAGAALLRAVGGVGLSL
ncbi:hypothetical protein D3C81_1611090 [compost metagenome]